MRSPNGLPHRGPNVLFATIRPSRFGGHATLPKAEAAWNRRSNDVSRGSAVPEVEASTEVQPGSLGASFSVTAVVAFILSLLWLGGLGSLIGAVLGGLAMRSAARAGQRGVSLAVAALIIGVLGLVGTGAITAVAVDRGRQQAAEFDAASRALAEVASATRSPSSTTPPTASPTTHTLQEMQQAASDAKQNRANAAYVKAVRRAHPDSALLASMDDDFILQDGQTTCSIIRMGTSVSDAATQSARSMVGDDRALLRDMTLLAAKHLCPA